MAKRNLASIWLRSMRRGVHAATRSGIKAGVRAAKQAARGAWKATAAPSAARRTGQQPKPTGGSPAAAGGDWIAGVAIGPAGARRYQLFRPPTAADTAAAGEQRLPLLVMLHGCTQDAAGFALSTRMNRIAARQRFFVLYPEQDRHAHPHGCWNWYATRTGQASGEAAILSAAVDQVCRLYPADRQRVALVGLSAGASMAALMAVLHPGRYRALVMHSGLTPGSAHSVASALAAMQGRHAPNAGALAAALASTPIPSAAPVAFAAAQPPAAAASATAARAASARATAPSRAPLAAGSDPPAAPRRPPPASSQHRPLAAWPAPSAAASADEPPRGFDPAFDAAASRLPPLLVIQGAADRTVVPSNGRAAAVAWAEALGAHAGPPRLLRRGQRHPTRVTDFKRAGRTLVSLCEVEQLGHAWSGGDARQPFGDAAGPDASKMAWAFIARQFGKD